MTRLSLVVLIILFLLHSQVYSQNGGKTYIITGAVVDDQNLAIPFANAAVYSNTDSTLVGGAASDETGVFAIDIKPGSYYLKISFLSYQEKVLPNINVTQNIDLGTIVLKPDSRILETV